MLMIAPKSRVTGIVAELERLLVDRQALVHHLETLAVGSSETVGGGRPSRAELSTRLEQLIARQTLLLEELTTIQPPAGRPGA